MPEFEIGIEDVPLQSDPVLSEALKAALRYLRAEGRQEIDEDAEQVAAAAILFEWLAGTLHSVRLANAGIVAVWQAQSSTPMPPENVAFLRERFFDS